MEVQGFTFNSGLVMLAIDVIVLAFLGFYLDQVLPKQYGVAKPWNFLCVGKSHKVSKAITSYEGEIDNEKVSMRNFEEVSA